MAVIETDVGVSEGKQAKFGQEESLDDVLQLGYATNVNGIS